MSTKPPSPRAFKPFAAQPGESIFVGVDVHKRSYHVCARGRLDQSTWVQPPDAALLASRLARLLADASAPATISLVAYEAGPTGFGLARALEAAGLPAQVVSPGHIPRCAYDSKSDRVGARRLAELASLGLLRPVAVPTPGEDGLRRLKRHRDQCRRDLSRAMARLRSFLLYHGLPEPERLGNWSQRAVAELRALAGTLADAPLALVLTRLLRQHEAARAMLAEADASVRQAARHDERSRQVHLLTTIPGVGELTAIQWLAELGDPLRFTSRLELAKYMGLSPDVRSSGQSRREGAPVTLSGRRKLKALLVEAAWSWVRYDPAARQLYGRMLRNTGEGNKAIVAVARKLGLLMWTLLRKDQGYRKEDRHAAAQEAA